MYSLVASDYFLRQMQEIYTDQDLGCSAHGGPTLYNPKELSKNIVPLRIGWTQSKDEHVAKIYSTKKLLGSCKMQFQ